MKHSPCLLFCLFLAALPVRSEEPTAKVVRIDGQVVVQRGAELLHLKKGQVAGILSGDTLQTQNGAVEIQYDNGTVLRIAKNTIVLFLSQAEPSLDSKDAKEKSDEKTGQARTKKPEATELRIRLVIGRITASIHKGPWEKTVFLLPKSRIALQQGDLLAAASAVGDWQVWLDRGELVVTDLPMKLVWRMVSGQRFRVEYLPRGVRISNLPKSSGPGTVQFLANGSYEIVSEHGSVDLSLPGKKVSLKEKERVGEQVVSKKTYITGFDPSESVVVLRQKAPPGTGPRPTGPDLKPEAGEKKTSGR
ncbi:MAG: hypothetical protein GXP25_18400 [Planctomycetes bacterium]|nr:hypothetical protein [Planctomycetota bacterium]